MSTGFEAGRGFRQRFIAGDHLVGTFIKTPAPHPIEIIGGVGFDFVIIDEEHAPWDRVTMDTALLAARASGTAGLVRVAEATSAKILSVLDDGAAGVLVPHVNSAAKAREVAAACRYRGGKRGFSNSTRAGGFGALSMWDHVAAADKQVTLIAMIEDPEALDEIDAIIGTDGLDGVFVGRADLTVALGASGLDAPEINNACERITAAAKKAKKPVAMMVANGEEASRFRAMGVSAFIISSDQGFMRQAALKAYGEIAALSQR
ncbi:HpcH/HpaI aldolase family protein [Rhodoligotrophos ferricapiens]|uniref:HpcH/HpaI aldolase family protein n=1 Tax=Rhodoligotrophos ferricapiens TaxID=3069264 RepID=UPI00315D0E04